MNWDNKQEVLEKIKNDGSMLKYASKKLKDDPEVVLEAVKSNGYAIQYASENMRNNIDIALEALKENGNLWKENIINHNLLENKEFMTKFKELEKDFKNNVNTYFYYNKEGKRITDGNTYFPDLLKDKDTGKFEIGYYGHSNMGRTLMITGEIKDLLKYSDGQNILKEIYEKNVNMDLKKDLKKAFYNNQDFRIETTLNKFKEVKDLLVLPTNTLTKENLEKDFVFNNIGDKFTSYIYDTRINKDISSDYYKAKNNKFTIEDNKFFPNEIKEATKDSYIFERIIDYAMDKKFANEEQSLTSFRYQEEFNSLVFKFSEDLKKEKEISRENPWSKVKEDKSNAWIDKVNSDKASDLER